MSLNKTVNNILTKMHSQPQATNKGAYGEQAVFSICEDVYNKQGGILIHSYEYRTVKDAPGNIKKNGNGLYVENTGSITEIDILLVTPYKMFPIEVKAYKSNIITLTNREISGCRSTDKSPVHQNEMHMRHLYPQIFQALPDGLTKYIEPIVCFADKTTVIDKRTSDQKEYIKVTILNQLYSLINLLDVPYCQTILDLKAIELRLKQAMTSSERFLPFLGIK